jgi:hypothetical protein
VERVRAALEGPVPRTIPRYPFHEFSSQVIGWTREATCPDV